MDENVEKTNAMNPLTWHQYKCTFNLVVYFLHRLLSVTESSKWPKFAVFGPKHEWKRVYFKDKCYYSWRFCVSLWRLSTFINFLLNSNLQTRTRCSRFFAWMPCTDTQQFAIYWVASPHFTTVLVKCRTYIFAYWLNFKARGQWDTLTRNRNTLIQGFFTFCFDQGEKQTFQVFNNWVKLLVLLSLEYVSWFFTWNRSTQMFVITSWIHLNNPF